MMVQGCCQRLFKGLFKVVGGGWRWLFKVVTRWLSAEVVQGGWMRLTHP